MTGRERTITPEDLAAAMGLGAARQAVELALDALEAARRAGADADDTADLLARLSDAIRAEAVALDALVARLARFGPVAVPERS